MNEFLLWFLFFLFALDVEIPVFAFLLRSNATVFRAVIIGFIANAVTHPALWFLVGDIFESYLLFVIVGETAVILAESVIIYLAFRSVNYKRALFASVCANMASLFGGFLVQVVILLLVR